MPAGFLLVLFLRAIAPPETDLPRLESAKNVGLAALEEGNLDEARRRFETVRELAASEPLGWADGAVVALRAKDLARAKALLSEALAPLSDELTTDEIDRLIALGATCLLMGAGASRSPEPSITASAAAWRGLVGAPRPAVAVGQRMIVLLKSPSVADRVAQAGGKATEIEERVWIHSPGDITPPGLPDAEVPDCGIRDSFGECFTRETVC